MTSLVGLLTIIFPKLSFPNNRCLVASVPIKMPIQTIIGDICLPAEKPLRVGGLPIQHLGERTSPPEILGYARPKRFGVIFSPSTKRLILAKIGKLRLRLELRWWRKLPILLKHARKFSIDRHSLPPLKA